MCARSFLPYMHVQYVTLAMTARTLDSAFVKSRHKLPYSLHCCLITVLSNLLELQGDDLHGFQQVKQLLQLK